MRPVFSKQFSVISERIHRLATSRTTLAALAIFVLFALLVLPAMSGQGEGGQGTAVPDLTLGYSASTLYQIADDLGETGRAAYIRGHFTFDMAWPLAYAFFLVTAISWLARRGFDAESLWQRANLLPLAAALFDLLENTSTSLVMARYPAATPVAAELAGGFTLVKWLLAAASFGALVGALGTAVYRQVSLMRQS